MAESLHFDGGRYLSGRVSLAKLRPLADDSPLELPYGKPGGFSTPGDNREGAGFFHFHDCWKKSFFCLKE